MKLKNLLLATSFLTLFVTHAQQKKGIVVPNENLITENIAEIPKELSNDVCSLTQNKKRYTISCVMQISNEGLWVHERKLLFLMSP